MSSAIFDPDYSNYRRGLSTRITLNGAKNH